MYFEDLYVGQRFVTPGQTVSEAEIFGFAGRYDPQYLHLDAVAAQQGPFAGIIASGFHTLAVAWSLWLRVGVLEGTSAGGIGIDALRWTAPVRPGDTLTGTAEVVERTDHPRKGRGRVVFAHTIGNQRGEVVLTFRILALVALRPQA